MIQRGTNQVLVVSQLFSKIGLLNAECYVLLHSLQPNYRPILFSVCSLCSNRLLSVFLSKASTPGDLSGGGGHQRSLCQPISGHEPGRTTVWSGE